VDINDNDYGEELNTIDVSGLYTNDNANIQGISDIDNGAATQDMYGAQVDVAKNYENMTIQELEQGLSLEDDIILQSQVSAEQVPVDNVGLDFGEAQPSLNGASLNFDGSQPQLDVVGLDFDETPGQIQQGVNDGTGLVLDDLQEPQPIIQDINYAEGLHQEVSAFTNLPEPNKKRIKKRFRKDEDLVSHIKEEELPIIEMYRVYKSYQPGVDAVKNINFRIKKGEFVFIVGHSGSGKTTLMNLMMNAIRPSSGRVYVNGYELTRLHKRKIAKFRRGIGVVFQDFKLLGDRDVFENIAFAQRVIEKTTRQVNKNVPEVLSLVGLTHKQKALPSELSGGEQQRVAIARALVNQPTILLADEPTGNLDPKTAWEIMDLLEEINKRGTTVIVVTHNLEIVEAMRKRVITIDKGNIVEDGIKGDSTYEIKDI